MTLFDQHINKNQLLGAIFNELGGTVLTHHSAEGGQWIIQGELGCFRWVFTADNIRPLLVGHLDLCGGENTSVHCNTDDVLTSNTALFSAFPATITQDADSATYLLSWHYPLNEGLQAWKLQQIMKTMHDIKKVLLTRWAAQQPMPDAAKSLYQLH